MYLHWLSRNGEWRLNMVSGSILCFPIDELRHQWCPKMANTILLYAQTASHHRLYDRSFRSLHFGNLLFKEWWHVNRFVFFMCVQCYSLSVIDQLFTCINRLRVLQNLQGELWFIICCVIHQLHIASCWSVSITHMPESRAYLAFLAAIDWVDEHAITRTNYCACDAFGRTSCWTLCFQR